ncbi:type II toxin-antitoxin system VapC family toxin [Microbacterium sp. KUDC0406]|uniref:type II toxin-antitoxin system VapC family toxin n=1 Tax=Microbacterium sp. KUDC0406 TaxID=2909588 RepID=UPI001F4630B1|nr:type II toxin-antitoxin system VapC family toxin [Microbacterium sp. KUDC0406]UJP09377.1 type II toxin-antitoxin system VapC family toxin [Microbacterium sp. KUDC0406]
MIVIDASAVVKLIGEHGTTPQLHEQVFGERLIAPDVLPLETASALRGLSLGGHLDKRGLHTAVDDLMRLPIDLHPSLPLIPRVMALRQNFSAYDASYVALAELFGCPLLTFDKRLAKAAQKHCMVEIAEE